MTIRIRPEVVAALRARLEAPEPDHPDFVGPPLEGLPLTPHELGELSPDICAKAFRSDVHHARRIAREILDACHAVEVYARYTPNSAARQFATQVSFPENETLIILQTDCEMTEAMRAQLQRLMSLFWDAHLLERTSDDGPLEFKVLMDGFADRHITGLHALMFASVLGEPWLAPVQALARRRLPQAAFVHAEREALLGIPPAGQPSLSGNYHTLMTDEPVWLAHARRSLEQVASTLDDLHAGRIPFVADKIFARDDTPPLVRVLRVALKRDDPWLRTLVGRFYPRLVIAPTAAKTAPSQSLAIALGDETLATADSARSAASPRAVRQASGRAVDTAA